MIAATRSAISSSLGQPGPSGYLARFWRVALMLEQARRPAPAPRPRRVAAGLQGLLTDDAALSLNDRAGAAARAFTAGDGFLPGQIIDRSI